MEQPESLREQSLDWFFSKTTQEKEELKEKVMKSLDEIGK